MRTAATILACGCGLGPLACSLPGTTQEDGAATSHTVAPEPEAPLCRPSPGPGAWARFQGGACDWELREEGGSLVLASLALDAPPPLRGDVPEPCRAHTCIYNGTLTTVGPVVVAAVPSTSSEMPSDAWVVAAVGDRLVSTSLWEGAGPPVESDYTSVGPSHALWPFVCGSALVLLVVERLDPTGLPAPDTLRAREGRLRAATPEDPAQAEAPAPRAGCRSVELPVP